MAVEQELLSHLSVIPLFKLDLDGTLTATEMDKLKKKNHKEEEQLTHLLTKWQQA